MKQRIVQWGVLGLVLVAGYVWGRIDATTVPRLSAQEGTVGPSDEAQRKILAAHEALKVAMEALKAESLYTPATRGMNVYGILTGGLNAIDDLEAGRGVDPETFAALYSDLADDEVQQHISKDSDGRLTYKNKLIRIYPTSRLKRLYQQRQLLTGEIQRTSSDDDQ
ncbi:hypothetical protein GC163_08885 [bacterium]|nr:hypothetical protein [bacterium]